MQLFRGYVPTKDKQCLEKFKGRKRLNTLEDVQDLDEYAAILGEETILIDVDDGETSDLLFKIVQDLALKCRVYATTRGKHFYFKNPEGYVEKSWTKQTLALGIETDAKVGRNNSYAIMRFKGVDRPMLQDCPEDEIQELPKWLTPVKTNMKFLDTAATADALDITEEDLSYLRDIAEREAINRFTTAEIKVEQTNTNYIDKETDLDGIMDAWANDFAEKLDVSEEGVHE